MKKLTRYISHLKDLHSLNEYLNEKLMINKEYKTPISQYMENIDSYQWSNDHLGLLGDEDMFDNFYDWLSREGKKISRNELISLKSSSYLMAIDKLDKKIILFVQSFGIKFCTIEIYWRPSNNKDERLRFGCYDDCGASRVWPYNSNTSFNSSIEYYKIDEKVYDNVLNIFNKHWER